MRREENRTAAAAQLAHPLLEQVRRAWIETLGKWSMLDVFVVALSVVAIQMSLVSDVEILPGIYLFTAAVALSIVAVGRIASLARRRAPHLSRQPGAMAAG